MIAVITYDIPHKKTQDVIVSLIAKGYKEISLIVQPWVERKNFKSLIKHRPNEPIQVTVDDFAANFGISLVRLTIEEMPAFFLQARFEYILIAGAGILPENLTSKYRIVNSHPGLLPYVKGLDALKWALLEDQPIGVTTHIISPETDEGLLIERQIVPVYFEDSFYSLAMRVYEKEIDMLSNTIRILENNQYLEELHNPGVNAHRRMPNFLELKMMEKFNQIRRNSPSMFE